MVGKVSHARQGSATGHHADALDSKPRVRSTVATKLCVFQVLVCYPPKTVCIAFAAAHNSVSSQ